MATDNESLSDRRIRTLTSKANELYEEKEEQLRCQVTQAWDCVDKVLKEHVRCHTLEELKQYQRTLCKCYGEYRMFAAKYRDYLDSIHTTDSLNQLEQHEESDKHHDSLVNLVLAETDGKINNLCETRSFSVKSGRSQRSVKSASSSRSVASLTTQAKAKAKAALARKSLIEKQTTLLKRKIDIDAEIQAFEEDKIVKASAAELEVYEGSVEDEPFRSHRDIVSEIQEETQSERTQKFVNSISSQQMVARKAESLYNQQTVLFDTQSSSVRQSVPIQTEKKTPSLNPEVKEFVPQGNNLASELSRFMLRKELSLSSLTKFDDKPENFPVWKVSFKSVIQELSISSRDELDLLVKWLGPESRKHAISVRASSSSNPENGVQKLWDRLDERFGAPEMVESSLRKKLETFPRIYAKDTKRLFELADILDEIENNMSDPKYAALLSYYNTSIGVIPIVNKLPYNFQEKWTMRAARYKSDYQVPFPPFSFFTKFIREMSKIRNDPGFIYESGKASSQVQPSKKMATMKTEVFSPGTDLSGKSTPVSSTNRDAWCLFHNVNGHTINSCRNFGAKPIAIRKKFIREKGLCFRCCETDQHRAKDCTKYEKCERCKGAHATALHLDHHPVDSHGGENPRRQINQIHSACAQICGDVNSVGGRSCARIVPVYVYRKDEPEERVKMYALLDDQSNRSLVKPDFFSHFGGQFEEVSYTLSSCMGKIDTWGRRATDFVVESLDGSSVHLLPTLTECNQIPEIREEIPTPEAARAHPHLADLVENIPALDDQAPLLLLIGRDLAEAHHVRKQRIGPRGSPFAQEYSLGWVIIGEVCLGGAHLPDIHVCANKTYIRQDRVSLFPPCENRFFLKDRHENDLPEGIFGRTADDDKIGFSAEDEEFLELMKTDFKKTPDGWSAPLPFREPRPKLPNNRDQALKRTRSLQASLKRDPEKQQHFLEFMGKIFENSYAELGPPLGPMEECWYLPIFGVYHAKKKSQIRVVFDSAAQFKGVSLNSVLLQGPNLMNSLLGVLMRFRRHPVAVTADIQQMFFQFRVHAEHRNYLRFIWFKDNDPEKELTEYRMCSHVFGNSPSPAIAAYGLKKTAADMEPVYGTDMRDFVEKDFYVDDGLSSFPDAETAIDLVTRTKKALKEGGCLHLHKIASNNEDVMKAFPKEDLAKDLQDVSFESDTLPTQRSLGMHWILETDSFTYIVSKEEKPLTRRGVLSTVNSLFDPLGFVAPVVNQGRLLMRDLIQETLDWDQPLPEDNRNQFDDWRKSLADLEKLTVPRMYIPLSTPSGSQEIHIFSDASEKAISSVAYVREFSSSGTVHVGFVLGKSKVAPQSGHTIPRLELCAAVLSTEIAETISEQLSFPLEKMTFYTDSQVVLGYLNNKTRRFYIYVQNRIARILKSTTRDQWHYVSTDDNPADQGTRPIMTDQIQHSKWLNGPEFLKSSDHQFTTDGYELQSPDEDKEIRPIVKCMKTDTQTDQRLGLDRFEGIKSWQLLVKVIALLKSKALQLKDKREYTRADLLRESERIILKGVQHEAFSQELVCLSSKQLLPKNSSILQLNPYLDEYGLLCVGGRLGHASELSTDEKYPIILPKGHFVSRLIALHYHSNVRHQGRQFTEGAIRSAGFWIVGVKLLVRSIINDCVMCKKLRGKVGSQIMSDLPDDRISPGPPFSSVGVDVFGPWNVTARRTRGGMSQSKRWAVLYTCLTTRAIHLEVIEELSTSSFINATRRFIAIRGPVRLFRSDRGTNFVGATECMKVNAINIEDRSMQNFIDNNRTTWIFNSPHSSHMGGVWERLIGVVRRILESMLRDIRGDLSHEVLTTFMAEVSLIVNSRPLVSVSTDPENPNVLSPMTLLTLKSVEKGQYLGEISVKDMYKAQWRRVQCLSDTFWKRWRNEYLQTLQQRKKWPTAQREIRIGDIVLMVEDGCPRNSWPMGVIQELFPSKDGHIRKVLVKVNRAEDNGPRTYVRPITKLVTLIESEDKCD